jgi:DNA-binding IscR family transcriptional regulator
MTDVRDAIATILDNMTLAQFVAKGGQDAQFIPAGE